MKRQACVLLAIAALVAGILSGCAGTAGSAASTATGAAATGSAAASALDTGELFTDRDMEQTADTANAQTIGVTSGENPSITEEGVYVLSGAAEGTTIVVQADSSAKVQLVLDGLTISNADAPAIYVASADKVFVTTTANSANSLSVAGNISYGENVDGVIFSKDDLVLNGQGSLSLMSSAHGIVGKDDVKITGGTYDITASEHGIQGKDLVAINGGTFNITAGTDGIHGANADDTTRGHVYIADGSFTINATSDGISAQSVAQFDGGTFDIRAAEGIEGTFVQINGGTINVQATDDGINATNKSTSYSVVLAINGGVVSVDMGTGDTDALDSNGDLIINGGTVGITAQSPFDYDGAGELNGGEVTVNGSSVSELTASMGGNRGGAGGAQGGPGAAQGQRGDKRLEGQR